MPSYLLLNDGGKIELANHDGFLLLTTSVPADPVFFPLDGTSPTLVSFGLTTNLARFSGTASLATLETAAALASFSSSPAATPIVSSPALASYDIPEPILA